jgi:hypothetical protein
MEHDLPRPQRPEDVEKRERSSHFGVEVLSHRAFHRSFPPNAAQFLR